MAQFSINRNRLIVNRIIGHKFGRLTVLEVLPSLPGKKTFARCRCKCDCGKETICRFNNLDTGTTKSCGCLYRETRGIKTHGMSQSSEYASWSLAKDRCFNVNNKKWADYGGRGITMCKEWRASFQAFIDCMGRKPTPKHEIDRIDNNGNYEPGNCRWATRSEQNSNQRRYRQIEHDGQAKSLHGWCIHFGEVQYATAKTRVRKGIDPITACATPRHGLRQSTRVFVGDR